MISTSLLRPADAFTTQVLERFYPSGDEPAGASFLIPKLRHVLFAHGELSVWSGLNGHGKSLLLNQLVLDLLLQGEVACIASFEMSAKRNLYRMVRQAVGASEPEEALITSCLEWLGERLFIYDFTGRADINHLLKDFLQGAKDQRITHFVIDSLMKCGLDEDDYNGQKAFVDRLQNFAQKVGVHVHLVAHSRKKPNESETVGKMDVRGAASITDLADNVLSLWRNKEKEEKVQALVVEGKSVTDDIRKKPDALLDVLKHRELGGDAEGRYGLYYDRPSMQFKGAAGDYLRHYFEGSR